MRDDLKIGTFAFNSFSSVFGRRIDLNDEDYRSPFDLTGELDKATLTIDRFELSPDGVVKLWAAARDVDETNEREVECTFGAGSS